MDNNKLNWLKYWDERGLSNIDKIANGRGSYPDSIYQEIYKDIIKLLNINESSIVLCWGRKWIFYKTNL